MVRLSEEKNPILRFGIIILSVILSGIILFAFVPSLFASTISVTTETNEGAGPLHFNYNSRAVSYEIQIDVVGDELVIGGSAPQRIPIQDTIIYADTHTGVWMQDGILYLGGEKWAQLDDSVRIVRNGSGVTVTSGEVSYSLPAPSWCYVPNNNGGYAFFPNGTEIHRDQPTPLASAGRFAGVSAYNGYVSVPYVLSLDADMDDDYIASVGWTKDTAIADLQPVISFDPVIIPLDPGTPLVPMSDIYDGEYTDGDWTYNLSGNNAIISTYYPDDVDMEGAVIEIPSTVGGHPVVAIGNGIGPVFSGSVYNFTYTIPEGVVSINNNAFNGTSEPSGVIVIPESVTSIGSKAFSQNWRMNGLVIEGAPSIASDSFEWNDFEGVLNLGGGDWSDPSAYGLPSDIPVSDRIDSIGYIAEVSYTEEHKRTDTAAVLIRLIPLVFLIGLVIWFVHYINNRNENYGGWKK